MLDFNSILVFSKDPKKLADFYKQVFQKDPDWSEGGYNGFMAGRDSSFLARMTKSRAGTRTPKG